MEVDDKTDVITQGVVAKLEERQQEYRQYVVKGWGAPDFVTNRALISSVRVYEGPKHHRIHVWNRGGKAGELVVDATDGKAVLDALLPPTMRMELLP